MPKGYTGRILHVDLSNERTWIETPPEGFYRAYMGGSAMGMYYILKEVKPGIDALSPENVLTLMVGVTTGLPISGNSRLSANAKSPLSEGIGDAQAGGFFPAEMKFSGFDGVVVRGKASRPVYIWMKDGQAEIRDAAHLWGKTTSKVEEVLKKELGDDKIQIAQIGPAGEKQVRVACIINMANRANGRTGMGAVMGSKNLKAVVARGSSKKLETVEPKKISELAKWGVNNFQTIPDMVGLRANGTDDGLPGQQVTGTLPTRNWMEGQFEGWENISGERMTETILKERDTCYACTVHCKRVVETEFNGKKVDPVSGGPEYETCATLGSYCGIGDLNSISYGNMICNEYGMDTISAGATVSWAMECYEKGLLSEAEIGFPLKFGDGVAANRMLEMMALREGFGDVLAEGSARAAKNLGKGEEYLVTAKGQEFPAHMPQAEKRSLALIYAVNPFGADHQSHDHDPFIEEGAGQMYLDRLKALGFDHTLVPKSLDREKAWYSLVTQWYLSFEDSSTLCQFVWGTWCLYDQAQTVELVKAATGWQDFDMKELLKIGERRVNMMRVFNAREGMDLNNDRLPKKMYTPLIGTGPTAGFAFREEDIEAVKTDYYELAGWDAKTGNPTSAKLAELGLEWTLEAIK